MGNRIQAFIKKHGFNLLIVLGISALFFIIFCLVVRSLTGFSVSHFIPGVSDMAGYYIEINTAIENGIFSNNAGYNGFIFEHNVLSVANSLYFSAHGLFILFPYIFLGSIVGWSGASPLIIHLILLTTAFYFIYFCTGSLKKTVVVQVLSFSFVPLLIYFPTMMMEIQMYVWGIIIVALLYAFVTRPSFVNHLGFLIAVTLASAAKISNIVFIIPYFVLVLYDYFKSSDRPVRKRALKGLMMGGYSLLAVAVLSLTNMQLSAPYITGFLHTQHILADGGVLRSILLHSKEAFALYFYPEEMTLFVFMRYAVFGLALFLVLHTFALRDKPSERNIKLEALGLSLVLLSIAFFNIMFNDLAYWRDFRSMAPVLFAVIIYLTLRYDKFAVAAHVCATLCAAFLAFLSYTVFSIQVQFASEFYHTEFAKYMHYDPDSKTRYGNTVILDESHAYYFDIEAGLGVIFNMGSYTSEEMARLGIRYLVTEGGTELDTEGFYDRIASGDIYVLYELKRTDER